MTRPRIAVVDDEARLGEVLAMVLRKEGWTVEAFSDPRVFLGRIEEGDAGDPERAFDLVLTDLKMPWADGLDVLRRVRLARSDVPVLLMTAHATVGTAVEAMKEGAYDYLEKPIDNHACRAAVRRALEASALARENRHLRAALKGHDRVDGVVAASDAMRAVLDLATRAARGRASVFITGESGTGKELVARTVHYASDRVGRPFVAVNCGALAEGVLESELFGHEKGAFTGADRARAGLFERADGGTLLLDEVGEAPESVQTRLLRVLQEGEVRRVGGDKVRPVDVRVVAATHRDPLTQVEAGALREDLYYRLNVVPIHVPPLRERRADILPLALRWLEALALGDGPNALSEDAKRALVSHDWPGNVRELRNVVERACLLADGDEIEPDDLLLDGPRSAAGRVRPGGSLQETVDRAARLRIEQALHEADGARAEAASALGVDRTTLYRWMKRLGL